MLKTATSRKEDICPNCGTACAATDEFCTGCGKNLDELFEQLPDDWSAQEAGAGLLPESKFLLGWVGANAAGMLLGQALLGAVTYAALARLLTPQSMSLNTLIYLGAPGLAAGVVFGLLQWLAIRKYLPAVHGWFLATLLGMLLGGVAEWAVTILVDRWIPAALVRGMGIGAMWIVMLAGGVLIGLSQWAVLRRSVRLSSPWVIVVALAWSLSWVVMFALADIFATRGALYIGQPWAGLLPYLLGGALVGILSGAALVWLVRQNQTPDLRLTIDD